MKRRRDDTSGMPVGLTMGVLLSAVITALGCGVLAKMVDAEWVEERHIGYGVMIVQILAAYAGSVQSIRKIKGKKLVVALTFSVVCIALLFVVTVLLLDAEYEVAAMKSILILCGSFLGAMLDFTKNRRGNIRKIKISNC